jgi:hypothetical protein
MLTTRWAAEQRTKYHATHLSVAQRIDHLDALLRRELSQLSQACGRVPHRVFTEICGRTEPRPIGTRTLAKALIAAQAANAPRERLLAVAIAFEAWVLGLTGDNRTSVPDAWAAETREGAEADVAQSRVFTEPTLARLDAAIEETIDDLATKRAYLIALLQEREAACPR